MATSTSAARFVSLDKEDKIVDEKDARSTKRVVGSSVNVLKEYHCEANPGSRTYGTHLGFNLSGLAGAHNAPHVYHVGPIWAIRIVITPEQWRIYGGGGGLRGLNPPPPPLGLPSKN